MDTAVEVRTSLHFIDILKGANSCDHAFLGNF